MSEERRRELTEGTCFVLPWISLQSRSATERRRTREVSVQIACGRDGGLSSSSRLSRSGRRRVVDPLKAFVDRPGGDFREGRGSGSGARATSDADGTEGGRGLFLQFAHNLGLSILFSIPLFFFEMILALIVFTGGALYSSAALLSPQLTRLAVARVKDRVSSLSQTAVKALKSRTKELRRRVREMLADDDDDQAEMSSMTSPSAEQ